MKILGKSPTMLVETSSLRRVLLSDASLSFQLFLTPEKPSLCPIKTPEFFLLEITLKALPGPAPDDWVVL